MNYDETLQYLYNQLPVFQHIGNTAYKPGFDNVIKILNILHNPQTHFKTIHIAGTNGKGSVSHFLAAILQAAGYKVGLYTSPHLVDFGERIRVDGEKIDKQYVVDFVKNYQDFIKEIQPSFFEVATSMAFDYFSFCNIDVGVIEVGLGGRLDSTNVIQP
ncbi:MAG TPA: bifunctional folylpolyglutamate synthase/dihydrofolate synthase, partial [Paludibacteraceae bacterium]|nr:bifunctional folylpolyglutamate synthase/dihydrofolate synthase [Paludibacteraceae bacterium]